MNHHYHHDHETPTNSLASPTPAARELIEEWVMSSPSNTLFLFKGLALGIISGLLCSALLCCWLPCLHFFYALPGEDLHRFEAPTLRMRIRPNGGFRACARRRVRLFFMGREDVAVRERSDEEAGGNQAQNQTLGQDEAYMSPAVAVIELEDMGGGGEQQQSVQPQQTSTPDTTQQQQGRLLAGSHQNTEAGRDQIASNRVPSPMFAVIV